MKEVAEKINAIQNLLNRQMAMMRDVQRQVYNSDLSSFDTQVANISTLNKIVSGFLAAGAVDASLNVKFPLTDEELSKLRVKDSGNKFQYENTTKEQDEALKQYTNELVTAVKNAESNGNPKYRGFEESYKQLESTCRSVLVQLTKENDQNPMAIFDKMCTFTFNFSTSTYTTRYVQRLNLAKTLESALDNIAIYYGCETNPVFTSAEESYEKFLSLINDDTADGKKVGKFAVLKPTYSPNKERERTAYCYVLGLEVVIDNDCLVKHLNGRTEIIQYRWAEECYFSNSVFYTSNLPGANVNTSRKKNFTDDELDEFVYRMSGRTLREELTLADFEVGFFYPIGLMFQAWSANDGKVIWYKFRRATTCYARVIQMDKKEPEVVVRARQGGGGFDPNTRFTKYEGPGMWLSL